eukprot:1762623-Prorocentrum_lima.AAC.1
MTSSLVGSEMCIRDRRLVAWAILQPQEDQQAAKPQVVLTPHRERSGPVSYTHLTLPTICSV